MVRLLLLASFVLFVGASVGLRGLTADAPQDRMAVFNRWWQTERDEWREFIKIAEKQKPDYEYAYDSRALAVEALGEMKNREAVNVLITSFTWEYRGAPHPAGPLADYPCARALAAIGESAVPSLLGLLSLREPSDMPEKTIDLVAHILHVVYSHPLRGGGGEATATVERFAKRCDINRRANLSRLLQSMRDLQQERPARAAGEPGSK